MKLLIALIATTTTARNDCPVDEEILARAAKQLLPPAGRRLASSRPVCHHTRLPCPGPGRKLACAPGACESELGVTDGNVTYRVGQDRDHSTVPALLRAAAAAPRECRTFRLCWWGGDGAESLAWLPRAETAALETKRGGCFVSSAQPGALDFPWYNRDDAAALEHARRRRPSRRPLKPRQVYPRDPDVPFEVRSTKAVWRGGIARTPTCRAKPCTSMRRRLVKASLAHPKLLDARSSRDPRRGPRGRGVRGTGHAIPILDYFSRYQIVLVASGYGAAFRVGRHLANGQVVVLIRGGHEFDEWYYPLLTPWVDYVPVRLDGDDDSSLVAALERLAGNATLRSYISRNARCFWKRHFGHADDIMGRFVCGLSARQRKSNY